MKNTTRNLKRARRWCAGVLGAILLLTAPVASAEEAPDFGAVLEGIDLVPTRAQLEGAWPDAQARLVVVATEGEGWQRTRAISLLSLFPTPETRTVLRGLLGDVDAEVRRGAVYTLARTFGSSGDAALVAEVLRVAHEDADESVRQHAVRGLRWIDDAAVDDALTTLIAGGGPRADLASRVQKRRVKRMVTPLIKTPGAAAP